MSIVGEDLDDSAKCPNCRMPWPLCLCNPVDEFLVDPEEETGEEEE